MNDEYQFEADVADLARQLENTNFSSESPLKDALRVKLLQQTKPRRRFSPVYTLAGAAAALLLVLIVVISVPPSPGMATATTKLILTATLTTSPLTATSTELAVSTDQQENEPYDVFFMEQPPEGYVFHSTSQEIENGVRMTQIYYQRDRWQEAVKSGDPYTDTVDYLYIIQQPVGDLPEAGVETPIPANEIIPPPAEVFVTRSTFYDPFEEDGGVIFTASGEGSIKGGRKVHYASRREAKVLLQAWSYQLDGETLLSLLDNLESTSLWVANTLNLEMDAPGSCGLTPILPDPGEPDVWFQAPINKASYTIGSGSSETHTGIDLLASIGTPVTAAQVGRVVFAGWSNRGTGQTVILAHRNFYTLYAHLSEVRVACNDVVSTETVIGGVGSTGNTSGPHLHFEIIDAQGILIDPTTLLDF